MMMKMMMMMMIRDNIPHFREGFYLHTVLLKQHLLELSTPVELQCHPEHLVHPVHFLYVRSAFVMNALECALVLFHWSFTAAS